MTASLDQAIANAYRVFARYRLDGSIEVCRCPVCVAPQIERALVETPLRELSCAILAEYSGSAHGWGTDKIANDLRYLLPRYFELIARNEYPHHLSAESCLARLHVDEYRGRWPADEIDVIDQFFLALFLKSCSPRPSSSSQAQWA